VEALMTFLNSGAGLPAFLAAVLMPALACASGESRLSVDRVTPGLKAACRVVEAFWPGTIRLREDPRGGPAELKVLGQAWDSAR